nr:LON peptidase substrate-binding domain-containing protein [Armatimonas sp.]
MESQHGGRIAEVPLFPLDLVLFPQMVVPLHIFEMRYRLMIQRCLKENLPFGIVLMTSNDEATKTVATAQVGCLARIVESEPLPDGRFRVEVVGTERFRLLDTHDNHPYRSGLIEYVHDEPAAEGDWEPLVESVKDALKDYLTRQLARAGKRVAGFRLPDAPELLSFTAACVLPIANEDKQALLELTDIPSRLLSARDVLRRAALHLDQETNPLRESSRWEPLTAERFRRYRCSN